MVNKHSYINLDPGSSVALELDELEQLWVSRERKEARLRGPGSYFNLDPGTSVALNLNNLEQLWVNREISGVSVYDSHASVFNDPTCRFNDPMEAIDCKSCC